MVNKENSRNGEHFKTTKRKITSFPKDDSLLHLLDLTQSEFGAGDVIKGYRQMAHLTIAEVARLAELERSDIGKLERNHKSFFVNADRLSKLAEVFGVHPAVLSLQIMKLRWPEIFSEPSTSKIMERLLYCIESKKNK